MNSVKLLSAAALIAIVALLLPGAQPVHALMYGNRLCDSNDCASLDSTCSTVYYGNVVTNYFTCCTPTGNGHYAPLPYVEEKQTKGYHCSGPDYDTQRNCTKRYPSNNNGTGTCPVEPEV